ncbi:ATP synthase F0 subunit B [Edaphobacter bradus]|uniref:ATP synthase F0 subunit B n=1 Tax=Edaphobacter bradus TaxID=2259016 RepID=UPI0021DFCCDB|nr:ATP synthase F0 subunit B [Edaphobacter bradus]
MSRSTHKKLFAGLFLASMLIMPVASRLHAQGAAPVATSAASFSAPETQAPEKNKEEDETEAFRHSAAVKAIGAKLGLNPDQAATVFSVLNFAVLAILIGGFLLKKLPKTFRDRSSSIQKHLVEARTATEEANARLSGVEARLSKLDAQIAAMRAQAEKDIAAEEQRIKASVEEEKQRILSSAEQEITSATAQARRQLQQYAAELAIEQAARKLAVNAETDRLLVQDFARRLTGEKEGHN